MRESEASVGGLPARAHEARYRNTTAMFGAVTCATQAVLHQDPWGESNHPPPPKVEAQSA